MGKGGAAKYVSKFFGRGEGRVARAQEVCREGRGEGSATCDTHRNAHHQPAQVAEPVVQDFPRDFVLLDDFALGSGGIIGDIGERATSLGRDMKFELRLSSIHTPITAPHRCFGVEPEGATLRFSRIRERRRGLLVPLDREQEIFVLHGAFLARLSRALVEILGGLDPAQALVPEQAERLLAIERELHARRRVEGARADQERARIEARRARARSRTPRASATSTARERSLPPVRERRPRTSTVMHGPKRHARANAAAPEMSNCC